MVSVRRMLQELEQDYQSLVVQVRVCTSQLRQQAQQSKRLETLRTRTLEGLRYLSQATHCLPDLAQTLVELQQQADGYLSGLERELDDLARKQQQLQSERGVALRRIRQVKDRMRVLESKVTAS